MQTRGSLKATICEGEVLKNTIFTSLKSYVTISLGSNTQKTTIRQGSHPRFDESFEFDRQSESVLTVRIFEKGILTNQIIGEGVIALKNVLMNLRENLECPIFLNQKKRGSVMVHLEFYPSRREEIKMQNSVEILKSSDHVLLQNRPNSTHISQQIASPDLNKHLIHEISRNSSD